MNPKSIFFSILFFCTTQILVAQTQIYDRFEAQFKSSKSYENPLYEVNSFEIEFTSPSGKKKTVRGFWDGGTVWKVRFMPDELGNWTYESTSSDQSNTGLHHVTGAFECIVNDSELDLYQKGPIIHQKGSYHLSHLDGSPFFWTAGTAWNGALKSTDEEWSFYLNHRVTHHYNTIQLVTTQWRGGTTNAEGEVAFTGSGRISLNPGFFQRIDQKIEEANQKGLLVSPVILWALPFGQGTEFSPGYYLPIREAILLANYIVARYQGNHVVWNLGGDGKYDGDLEDRWKTIGAAVFGEGKHQGLVTLHPHGLSWIGDLYEDQEWYDLYTYQSSHSKAQNTVDWITKGPVSERWSKIRPMPFINTEPLYEEIRADATAQDIRNAWYWSIFSAPVAGITYGANGIWPWLREGEEIENHGASGNVSRWNESLELEGSIQMGYLNGFFNGLEWWDLKPASNLLKQQSGEVAFDHFVSVLSNPDQSKVLVYSPVQQSFHLVPLNGERYLVRWFDPGSNVYLNAGNVAGSQELVFENPFGEDAVLLLEKVN